MPPTPPDRPDEMLGEHYRVERELGHGGMATVYLCTDIRDGSRVAVKVLRPELGSVVTRERFFREIAFASELDHPRIPRVLDSGMAGTLPFYTMKFVEGESLRDRLVRERRLPLDEVRRIAAAIAGPTGYAHERSIVHRDIKPENILLAGDKVYVLDFGVARAIIGSAGDRLTRTGITVGTPAYMSPEQVTGNRDLDLRSDIYSLGCVVYEMLAGSPPFSGTTPQVLMAARFSRAPHMLQSIRNDIPESISKAVEKAMARLPDDRWQSVDAFVDALLPPAAVDPHLPNPVASNVSVTRIRSRAIEIVNDGGAMGLWFAAFAEVGYRRLVVREFSLHSPVEQATAQIELNIAQLGEPDLEAYNSFRHPSDPHAVRERLKNGDRCFVARHDGVIVGACWISIGRGWSAYLSAPISLASDEAYGYDLYTAPEWRENGIPAAVTSAMHRFCRAEGLSRVIGFTIPENRPAMTQSIGYRSIGVIGFVGFGNHRRFFCRMNAGERAPGQEKASDPHWDASVTALVKSGHYLDDFLACMKRNAYLDLIQRWGGVPPCGCVLKTDLFEEAMGPDAFLLELPSLQAKLIGMDVSGITTSMAREKDAGERAAYVRADTRALPFSDHSIEMIISPSTLDHFTADEDLDLSLNELRRVLVRGGRMIVTLDNRQNVFDPLLRIVNLLGGVPYYLGKSYTIGELRRRLENAGFDVLDTTAIVHHPRLVGVASVAITNRVQWKLFTRFVQGMLLRMQKLEGTRLQYFSGCFVAALAVPKATHRSSVSDRIASSVRVDRVV